MNTSISKNIKRLRQQAGLTQEQLAALVECTPQHISAIERGAKTPTLETFVAIAAALRVPADVLLQDVLPDWWENWDKEIDRVLAPLLPHLRAYIKKQIMDYHSLAEHCAQAGKRLPQR